LNLNKDNYEDSSDLDYNSSTSLVTPFKNGAILQANFDLDPVTGLPKMPSFDQKLNYMDEYWNIYLQNQALLAQIDRMANDRNTLLMKSYKIESFYD
jgi:hypothetical protein